MKNSISRRSFLKAVGALSAAGALAACGGSSSSSTAASSTAASAAASTAAGANIKLWTYPIGGWGKDETVQELISSFNAKYPDIKVTVEYLDYTNGDDQVNTAIEGGSAPDLIMEGPERLVANWGKKGVMAPLNDLWTDDAKKDIYASVESACRNDAGLTNSGDEIFPMAFPTESGDPKLCGGIWGFGIFDNGDEAKIEAAKTFIDFIAADPDQVGASVLASTYFPVRESVGDIYAGNDIMSEYTKFMGFLGDYYQITPGWATARTEWWNMLQRVGTGEPVEQAVATFVENANAAAAAEA